ncbi:MAG: mechanosensitive ion channel [Gammaproteobacteria bacterium]|nr:mechanosensitive ion channel [Gammaproteobacteria bacterium]
MVTHVTEVASGYATSPPFYAQLGAIVASILLAFLLAWILRHRIPLLRDEPRPGAFIFLRTFVYRLRVLVFALLAILLLGVAAEVAQESVGQAWLVKIAQSLAVIFLFYEVISRFIKKPGIKVLATWIGIPLATLHVFGWLDDVTAYLDGISLTAGNIRISLFALARTVVFGAVLFWLGRVSNTAGKQVIRSQQALDVGTREVFAKLFEIGLFVLIFLLLLQVMGINFTALAVFGGALGVGLGFGLQQIASNFISGIIILLDRSITIGDYIELEDGRAGSLRELNMRYGILETYDGKDIMVPNEQFITTSFTNWTHNNQKQRYAINFQVAYSTDLNRLFDMIREKCNSHPMVIGGEQVPIEERPDAEIAGFGDSGIDILVEFWMEGIDDGKNRVGADIMHMIWDGINELGMEIPFPQREVRILDDPNPARRGPSGQP